jgi:hypothetical protein
VEAEDVAQDGLTRSPAVGVDIHPEQSLPAGDEAMHLVGRKVLPQGSTGGLEARCDIAVWRWGRLRNGHRRQLTGAGGVTTSGERTREPKLL